MADVFSAEKRSEVMRRIRSKKNTSTELRLIKLFRDNRITGWKRNYNVKGHPDFVFLDRRTAIFVDGCFWHGHNCRNTRPVTNHDFWQTKQQQNIKHDREITRRFEARGWTVLRIWECELTSKNIEQTTAKLKKTLKI